MTETQKPEMSWRDLKRELFGQPPPPRSNRTLDVTDIFNAGQTFPKERAPRLNPTNQTCGTVKGELAPTTPLKVRNTKTLESVVFSEVKTETVSKGKKTYIPAKTALVDVTSPLKEYQTNNPHKLVDHGSEYFYDTSENQQPRSLKGHQLTVRKVMPTQTKPASLIKQEEIYHSEVGLVTSHLTIQTSKAIPPPLNDEYRSATPQRKRVLDNESSVFPNTHNYYSPTAENIRFKTEGELVSRHRKHLSQLEECGKSSSKKTRVGDQQSVLDTHFYYDDLPRQEQSNNLHYTLQSLKLRKPK